MEISSKKAGQSGDTESQNLASTPGPQLWQIMKKWSRKTSRSMFAALVM